MFWDNDEHLYAISPFAGTLHVYTITDATHEEAPGSPYAITQPAAIAVKIMQERRTWYPERETAVEK